MFLTVLFNVLLMLVYMLIGFILCKAKKGVASHAKTLSSMLVYIFSPAMIINSFLKADFSKETMAGIGIFFGASLFAQLLFFGVLFLIFRKKFDNPKYRIMTVASVLGNIGFFGLPIVTSLFPSEPIVSCYCMSNVVSMNIITFTLAEFLITRDRHYVSIKRLFLNPSTIAFLVALPLFIFGVKNYLPDIVNNSVELLGKMVTPLCMLILGMRLSTCKFKDLFTRPTVYISCLLKLVVFPLFILLLVYFIPGLSMSFKVTLFVLCATPSASFVLNVAEIHEVDQDLAANSVLLATMFTVITLPLLVLIVS